MPEVPSSVQVGFTVEMIADLSAAVIGAPGQRSGSVREIVRNAVGGERWVFGAAASGNVNTVFVDEVSMIADAKDSYDVLAAGAHLDVFGNTVDLDELKGLVIIPLTGAIRIDAPAANAIDIFDDATDLIDLVSASGFAMAWGASGIDVTTNSKFDIQETATAVATYLIAFWGTS